MIIRKQGELWLVSYRITPHAVFETAAPSIYEE